VIGREREGEEKAKRGMNCKKDILYITILMHNKKYSLKRMSRHIYIYLLIHEFFIYFEIIYFSFFDIIL